MTRRAILMSLLLTACPATDPADDDDTADDDDATTDDDDATTDDDDATADDDDATADDDDATPEDTPLFLTFAWHLEGWNWSDPAVYDGFMNSFLPETHALLDAHGAKATMEAHTDLVSQTPVGAFDDFLAAGHEVAVHADLGGNPNTPYNFLSFVTDLQDRKAELEAIAGPIVGVSGICSHLDWVEAAMEADFELVSGNVAYCTAAMANPPAKFEDCEGAGACHGLWPEALEERMAPWRTSDVDTYLDHDPGGALTMIPASGALPCFAEERDTDDSPTQCDFDQDDIDAFVTELDEALAIHETLGGVHGLNIIWSYGQRPDAALFDAWLSAIDPYVADGRVQWMTTSDAAAAWWDSQ